MFVLADTFYDWLLFLHIVAAMVWVGGVVVLGAFAALLGRQPDAGAVERFVRSLRVIGPIVLAPAPVIVLGVGFWLVADSEAWELDQGWIWFGFGLFAAAFLFGAAFQSRAAIAAQRSSEAGDEREAARQLRRWSWGSRLILLLLLVATWDMVFKPGL